MMEGLWKGFYQPLTPELLQRHWQAICFCFALSLPWLIFLPGWGLRLAGALFAAGLVMLAVLDGYYGLLYDRLLLPLGAVGLGLEALQVLPCGVEEALAAAASAGAFFLLLRFLSRGGMGLGDVKFAAVLGLWLGVQGTMTAVFLAVLAGGVAALLLLLEGRGKDSEIAFGPFLAMGAYVSYLWGSSLWQLYWGLLL